MSSSLSQSGIPLAMRAADHEDTEIAVKVDDLSKCYEIYEKPRDRLFQMLARGTKKYYRESWALKNASFEIRRGETVGIIGRNGSGKSTLLQLICGTLNATSGSIYTNGRIAALLELGSGFNPEFTGRENVYMAASLYGLTRAEISERFERIAAFANIGEYLDRPVKTYSSGMYVRLAFAVIAHVDADILVIDEALAVGDAVFTQKCMRFIREFQENGTLLFVSHDMNSVLSLCKRAVWLDRGVLRQQGPSKAVAEAYLQYTLDEVYGEQAQLQPIRVLNPDTESGKSADGLSVAYAAEGEVINNLSEANGWKSGYGEIRSVKLESISGETCGTLKGGETVRMSIRAVAHRDMDRPILGFLVRDRLGQDLFGENTLPFTDTNPSPLAAGEECEAEFIFRLPMLPNGQYVVMTSFAEGDLHNNIQHHWLHDALVITISSSKVRWGLVGINFERVQFKSWS